MSPPNIEASAKMPSNVGIFSNPDFKFAIDTRNTSIGSTNSDQFKPPTTSDGSYSCNIDWGDDSNSDISAWDDAALTHTYSVAGVYVITITGTFTGWRFNDTGDKLKITNLLNWGSNILTIKDSNAFEGCANLIISAGGSQAPLFSGTGYAVSFIESCSSITVIQGMENWDWSGATSGYRFAKNATNFNQLLPDMPNITRFDEGLRGTSYNQAYPSMDSVTNINTALYNDDAFDQDLTGLPWATITSATNFMLTADGISTENYDALLLHMDSESVSGLTVHFGGSTYTGGGAVATARANLVGRGCVISDGGIA